MNKKLGWLLDAIRKPVEASMFVYSTGLLFLSLYVMSPVYQGTTESSFSTFDGERLLEYFVALMMLLAALPGLISPFMQEDRRVKWLKHSTFSVFLAFFFLTVLRIAVAGWTPILWIYPLLISLSSGIKRLFLEVRQE